MERKEFKMVAKTFQGLEEVLAKELTNLGANDIEIGRRMVTFTGDKEMLYRANFCLRTAIRVLMPICEFKASDADELYDKAMEIPWEEYMDNSMTFRIDTVVFSDDFRHSKFVAYRVKDGIADYFRQKTGNRPNVVLTNPDIYIHIHISENDVSISLDSSGESLHKRGWREATVKAPINEVLAAGLIMLTGWDGQTDLIDPMCGSGTLLIEAALIANNIWPGVFRKEFAFEKWKDYDQELFERIYNDDSQEREFTHHIYGYDINRQNVSIAQTNVKAAGVSKCVTVEQKDIADFTQPENPAIMITNPPYGERIMPDDLLALYDTFGSILKHEFVGNDAWVISFKEECFDKIGMRPSTRFAIYNGALECEFRKYQVFKGRLSDHLEEGFDLKTDEDRKRNLKFKPHRHDDDDNGNGREMTRFEQNRKHFERRSRTDKGDSGFSDRREDRDERKPWQRDRDERKPWQRDRDERKPWQRDRDERKPWQRERDEGKSWQRERDERKPWQRERKEDKREARKKFFTKDKDQDTIYDD